MRKSAHQSGPSLPKHGLGQASKLSRPTSGQALLIILLVMAVGLTIALSIVSRSVTEIRISREEEESSRAFSAAEAGIEESLRVGSATIPSGFPGISLEVTQADQGGGETVIFDDPVVEGETKTVWLVGHDAEGNLDPSVTFTGDDKVRLYWGNDGPPDPNGSCERASNPVPALEATIYFKDDDDFQIRRLAFDPDAGRAASCNHFNSIGIVRRTLEGRVYKYTRGIDLPSGASITYYALRLRLLYNDVPHILAVARVEAGDPAHQDAFPTQGKCYVSTATTETGVSRKVKQCQSFPVPSPIFDYVLFSGVNLAK